MQDNPYDSPASPGGGPRDHSDRSGQDFATARTDTLGQTGGRVAQLATKYFDGPAGRLDWREGSGDLVVPLRSVLMTDVPAGSAQIEPHDMGAGTHFTLLSDPAVVALVAQILAAPTAP